jgi:hypothetical protein
MAIRVRPPAGVRPWVDQVATYIHDPVARLRFLKAVAPAFTEGDRSARPRVLRRALWVALAATAVILGFSLLRVAARTGPPPPQQPRRTAAPAVFAQPKGSPDVWLVEQSRQSETYSNGLRIDSRFLAATHARSYLAFPMHGAQPAEQRTQPAGIVFHTTESQQAPFEARQNGLLKRLGESLLDYVRRRRSYNFLIDRFGRVYRVVPEEQAANHAGHSLWADESWAYLNLNESFLGISFEAATRQPEISSGQVRSATMLIEMLRARYHISAADCVTHAQVSVNPSNMRVGYHLDWASSFPFEVLGLPDNYAAPLPSLWRFGFESDKSFRSAAGSRLQVGVDNAENRFAEGARAKGLQPAAYRKLLRGNYRELLAQVRRVGTAEGADPE